MNREKTLALVLLDLCAFACSQDGKESTRKDFEAACGLAEKHSLSEVKIYQAYVSSLEWRKAGPVVRADQPLETVHL